MILKSYIFLILFNISWCVNGASILALFSSLSYTDHLVYRGYLEGLSHQGHHIVVMTPYPGHFSYPEVETIVELDVSEASSPFWDEYKKLLSNTVDFYPLLRKINELSIKVAVAQLKSQQMTALFVNPNVKFDLVITEADMPILYAVAEKYNTPHIAITASSGKINMFESKGNPNHPLLYPDVNTLNFGDLSILQKITEFQRYVKYKYEYYYYYLPLCQLAAEKLFNLKKDLLEVEQNIDMLFVSGNAVLLGNRPTVPAVTYVDNLHIKRGFPLHKNLQNILDTSKKGVIYFSLGTVQEAEDLSRLTLQTIMDAFGELPYTVLFKIGNTTMIKKPDNVIADIWYPQQQVLAHPNVKAFVTHGGARSLEEAVFYGVPIIGLPILASRKVFISQITKHGAGVIIDPSYINKNDIKKAVTDVAGDDKYKKAILVLKDLTLDTALTGPERAIWYTDYVIRHAGAKHLRSPLVGSSFYKVFMLDILTYVYSIVFFIALVIYFIVKLIVKKIKARFSKVGPKGKFKSL